MGAIQISRSTVFGPRQSSSDSESLRALSVHTGCSEPDRYSTLQAEINRFGLINW